MDRKPRRLVKKACEQCGGRTCKWMRGRQRFCSKICYDMWQARYRNHEYRSPMRWNGQIAAALNWALALRRAG